MKHLKENLSAVQIAERDQLRADLRQVMAEPHGRRVIWAMLDKTGIYRSSFTGNSQTFYAEGERNVGLWLLALMGDVDPTIYPAMLLEKAQQRASDMAAAALEESEDDDD
jgi:hypothetical protein